MEVVMEETTYMQTISELEDEKGDIISQQTALTQNLPTTEYRAPEKNYFYHKTLFEFKGCCGKSY